MSRLLINGGNRLYGDVKINGAKNSVLPILAALVLCNDKCVIRNCPDLSDARASMEILRSLGCKISYENSVVFADTTTINNCCVPEDLMTEMRSSIIFLGAILSRMKTAQLSFPGGCELGPRPIDLHIKALKKMGAKISEQGGKLDCSLPQGRFFGANIALSFPSVGATENILLSAVLAKGTTTITNAAREPEIIDLAKFLNKCGAKIYNAGESTIVIEGVEQLHGAEHNVICDRIEAISFMSMVAITKGKAILTNVEPSYLAQVIPTFEEAGCKIKVYKENVSIEANNILNSVSPLRTMPYPGFPTDAQAPVMAMLTVAKGTSIFIENIFENRYKHVGELVKLGANIKVIGKTAVVEGVDKLFSADVKCTDLRGGIALVVAGLSAEGTTCISDIFHIDRGYENIELRLKRLGANIERTD